MPELPEIETIRRQLEPHLRGAAVVGVRVHRRDVIHGGATPRALLQGTGIEALDRLGKQLAVFSKAGPCLIFHMGMTGQLSWVPKDERGGPLEPHTHVVWRIEKGGRKAELRFRDPRRFGGVWTFPTPEKLREGRWSDLGPDALTVRTADLVRACQGRRTPIKSVLLDQRAVAGVGNIYADEALFASGLHPKRRACSLQSTEYKVLAGNIRSILRRATRAGGSTIRDYRTLSGGAGKFAGSHAVYGRAGLPCLKCGTPLTGIRLGGRATVLCPRCQCSRQVSSTTICKKKESSSR